MSPKRRSLSQIAASILSLGVAMPLAAQQLEEIVVTAQKREQSMQDVPISVEAFSSARIDNLVAQDIADLGVFATNVNISRAANQPSYSIRGIGTSDFGVGADPAVGVYLDGVYIGRSGGSKTAFNDIQRIEILNGPQGTLFGRNAAAGAIQYVSNKPVDETEGWFKLTLGNFNRHQVEGLYNHALSDSVFMRTGLLYNRRDGYIDNLVNGQDLGQENNWSLTNSLLWQASDDLSVLWRVEYDEVDQDSRPSSSAVFGPRDNGKAFRVVEVERRLPETRELFGTSLHVNYEMDWASFTSITSYRQYESYNPEEKDGSAELFYSFLDLNAEDNKQWSQEFRLSGTAFKNVLWTAGVNYSGENAKQQSGIILSTEAVDKLIVEREAGFPYEGQAPGTGFELAFGFGFPGVPRIYADGLSAFQAGEYTENVFVEGKYESYAVFADMTWSITDRFDLTAGLRYTQDEKEFGRFVQYNDFGIAFAFPNETRIDGNGNLDPNGALGWYFQEESWSELTPRVVLNYHINDDVMVYASWAEGFKAGGFNSVGERNDDPAFDPESVSNLEAGIKSTWLDGRLRVNAAYFDYEYQDLQALAFIPGECIAGTTTGNYQFETSDVDGSGFELSANWLVADGLEVWMNTGSLDAEYTSRIRRRVVNGQCDFADEAGEKFNESPDLNYNLGASYALSMHDGAQLDVSFAWHFADGATGRRSCKFIEDNGNGTSSVYGLDTIDGVLTIVDPSATGTRTAPPFASCPDLEDEEFLSARATYTSSNDAWEISAWITNATDWASNDDNPGGLGGELASNFSDGSPSFDRRDEPRMYGMELKYSF